MFIEYYLYYLYYTFLGFPFIIRVAVFAITVFVPVFAIAFFTLTHVRQRYYQKRRLQEILRKKYYDKIRSIITSEKMYLPNEIETTLNCNVKKLSKKKKRILTNNILKIYDREEFVNESNYQRLIDYFGLRQFWEGKLKYGTLASRQRALRKLDDFDIEIPGSVITSLTYNRNQYLRKRARSSYMYFSKNSPFKFLDENFDKTFNNWDKVEIHRMLNRRLDKGLPNLSQWLKNSENSDFQCFLVDEIKHFNQDICAPYLHEMLETQDIMLRKHCIEALGEMRYCESEKSLVNSYAMQPLIVQQSIIKAVQKLNTGKSLSFLEQAYNDAHDSESRIAILRAIFNYGEKGKVLFASMKNGASGFSALVFEHVSNPLIK